MSTHKTPTPTSSPTPSPTPTPTHTPAVAHTAGPASAAGVGFGIAAGGGLSDIGTADLNKKFADMRSLGISWVRFDVDWSQIQPNSSATYNWAGYDRVVAALRANGLSGLGVITYTPGWARQSVCRGSDKCSPADPGVFAAFAGAVAVRYAPQGIHTWEIWNEPNSSEFWQPAANTGAYTQLLKLSYNAIKQQDRSATVLSGGTASMGTGNNNFSPSDFIAGIYANGGKGYFDAVADHPYSRPFLPSFNWYWNSWQQMDNTQPSIRGVMVANGDAAKKVWITEFGAATNGPGSVATTGLNMNEQNADHVTEALQSTMVTTAISLYRGYTWTGPFFWYSYQDNGTSLSDPENFYGLLRADGSRKPAYYALQQAIRQ